VARKEFYHTLRDIRSLYLAFAIPLLLVLLFGYALSLDVKGIPSAVIDHDQTPISRDFLRHLAANPYFHIIFRPSTTKEAIKLLDYGKVTMVIIIPPAWAEKLKANRTSPLQILLDGSDPNYASLSRAYITTFIEDFRQVKEKPVLLLDSRIRVWFNEELESRLFIVPGIIAVIIMIVGAILTSLVIAREYENVTMDTIKVLPLSAGEFLVGKALPYFFIAVTDVIIAMLLGEILLNVTMKGNFWILMMATVLYIGIALSLGLFISIVTKSQLVANHTAVLTTYLPSLLLSNFVFPVNNMPWILKFLSSLIPATYYLRVLMGIYLKNVGVSYLIGDFLILSFMLLGLMTTNYLLLRREGM